MSDLSRPVLRYHGGKWKLAHWIISHFPKHHVYVEPYGGAASVLLRKPRSYGEVYNDLDGEVVNLFRVLRDPVGAHFLIKDLGLTPFSREEFEQAYEISESPVERARRMVIRSFMGFGSAGHNIEYKTGFRATGWRMGNSAAMDWRNYPDCLNAVADRLKGVVIEHKAALDVIAQNDAPDTLFYVDPPYVLDTRHLGGRTECYAHEMTDQDHQQLLSFLQQVKGYVILSGYDNPLYATALTGWTQLDYKTWASGGNGAVERMESLWLNPACVAAQAQRQLFTEVA